MTDNQFIDYELFRTSQQSFQIDQFTIKYTDYGEGPVILLIHGVPTSSWLYRKMIKPLADQGYRVIAPDLLGYGSSSKPKGYDVYSPENQCLVIARLMEHLRISSWTHVMHDVGGLWSWEMMKLVPEKVERLVLLNTIIYEEGFLPPMRFSKNWKSKMYARLYKSGLFGNMMMKATLKNGVVDYRLKKHELRGYRYPFKEGSDRAIMHFFSNTCRSLPDYSNVLSKIDAPVMIIWGARDKILVGEKVIPRLTHEMNIEERNIHMLDNCKHFIQEEQPGKIAMWIGEFIKQ